MPEPEEVVQTPFADEPTIEAPERLTIADALADLVRMFVDYVRQETGDLMHDKVVLPTQKAGQVVAFALAAAAVLFLGICYISVALLLLLAAAIGWPWALLLVGAVLVVAAGGFTALKMRSMKR